MIGIELNIPGKQIVLDAIEEGLLINCTHETVLRCCPVHHYAEGNRPRHSITQQGFQGGRPAEPRQLSIEKAWLRVA